MAESFEQCHATLIREFNEFLFEHPEFAEEIPAGAIVVIQVADDEGYNSWSRALAEANREPGRPLVYVHVDALAPRRSRLVNPQLRLAS
ncbi:MAG TPA: DUF5647 family protein [Candidatus Methylomirabilis sp.]|nr:DUF5647 family protein [Candidatus Methylomirabilis sp.]HSB80985.1 DUF5647 family protein [Candidatus Methylomirabilis sp.]